MAIESNTPVSPLNSFKVRIIALFIAIAVLFSCGILKIMEYQVVNGADWLKEAKTNISSTQTTTAARGDIVDRYGRVLATSTSVYNVVFNYSFTDRSALNETIYNLMEISTLEGVEWVNKTPITGFAGNYEFSENSENSIAKLRDTIRQATYSTANDCVTKMYSRYKINTMTNIVSYPIEYVDAKTGYAFTDEDESDIEDFKEEYNLNQDLTANQCIEQLIKSGELIIYSEADAFDIACIRYSMESSAFSVNNQYVFAEDIQNETIIKIKEQSHILSGVDVINEPVREYVNGEVATHLLGTVGPLYAEDLENDKYKDYPLDSIIGKSGIESVYESDLRGIDGEVNIIQNDSGDIIGEQVVTEPQKGNTIQLTIDSVFQAKIQKIFQDYIVGVSDEGYASTGGAVVVLDAKTGEVLASVTEPTYSVETYKNHYSELLESDIEDPLEKKNPLINKAINGQYRPGSTFKPIVATAGLQEGYITPFSTILCENPFVYYKTPYGCLQSHHSGYITVYTALQHSCNTFFYKLGDMMGLDTINEYASALGLGVDTGLEIYQANGRLTEYTDDNSWYIGKIVQAAIGQADTYVSPLQMAVQAMTIANQGVRYETHIIDEIIDAKGDVVFETQPVVASTIEISDDTHEAVTEGMRLAAARIVGENNLTDLGYGVALKTGTPQTISNNVTNNAFLGFTHMESPEIAVAVMVENSNYGSQMMFRDIIMAYDECKLLGEAESVTQFPQRLEDIE